MITPEQKRLLELEKSVLQLLAANKLMLQVIDDNVHKINGLCELVANLNKRVAK